MTASAAKLPITGVKADVKQVDDSGVYKPRRPQASPLFRLVSDHVQRLQKYCPRFTGRGRSARAAIPPRSHSGPASRSNDPQWGRPDGPRCGRMGDQPRYCLQCDVRFACNGECPKHRFARTPDGEAGLNYLCRDYKRFFHHVAPYTTFTADQLRRGEAPAAVMALAEAGVAPLHEARPNSTARTPIPSRQAGA